MKSDRSAMIKEFAEEMHELHIQKNSINGKITSLYKRVNDELDIPRDDFRAAIRLHVLAGKRNSQTAAHIREILQVLGTILPEISSYEPVKLASRPKKRFSVSD